MLLSRQYFLSDEKEFTIKESRPAYKSLLCPTRSETRVYPQFLFSHSLSHFQKYIHAMVYAASSENAFGQAASAVTEIDLSGNMLSDVSAAAIATCLQAVQCKALANVSD